MWNLGSDLCSEISQFMTDSRQFGHNLYVVGKGKSDYYGVFGSRKEFAYAESGL